MKAKKSLGQNFLVDEKAIDHIVSLVPENTSLLLEIGPGRGALTHKLAARVQNICLLEKDEELLASTRTVLVIDGIQPVATWAADALEFNFEDVWRVCGAEKNASWDNQLTVASNLPYNVATEILFRLFEFRDRIPLMVLMFQKEVAARIAAGPGSKAYGAISVILQNFYAIEWALRLPPTAFRPTPKVESGVLVFRRRKEPLVRLAADGWATFRHLVEISFRYRRKTLENSLKMGLGGLRGVSSPGKKDIQTLLQIAGIDGKRRAETLSIQEFEQLYKALVS